MSKRALSVAMGPQAAPNPSARRALLVGIHAYPRPAERLHGCAGDAQRMKAALLTPKYGFDEQSTRTLLNADATRAAIADALDWLCSDTAAGDVRVFYYSGHGSVAPDTDGDEEDGTDECLCPVDYEANGKLTDDDLAARYARVARGTNLVLIMDCCHSGTIQHVPPPDFLAFRSLRPSAAEEIAIAGAAARYHADRDAFVGGLLSKTPGATLADLRRMRDEALLQFTASRAPLGNVANREESLLVAACQSGRLSSEATLDGRPQGALTYFLLQAMDRLAADTPAEDVVRTAAGLLHDAHFSQIPQIEGTPARKRRPLFAPLA